MRFSPVIPFIFVLAACEGTPGVGGSSASDTDLPASTGTDGDAETASAPTSGSSGGDTESSGTTDGEPEPDNQGWSIRDEEPYGRSGHVAILDEAGDRMIVFGGGANDTWELPLSGPRANQWSELVVSGQHPPVHAYGDTLHADAAVYDPAGQRMLVLLNSVPVTASANSEVELWELSLSGAPKWRRVETAGPDPGIEVQSGRLVLDRDGDRLFVVGGSLEDAGVWSLSLAGVPTWSRFADTPVEELGAWYVDASLLLDASRAQLVLFGGHPRLQRIWGLSLATAEWTLLDEGSLASGSYGATSVLDAANDRIIIFGGDQTQGAHVFSLATQTWTAAGADGPAAQRTGTSGVVDAERGRVLYFGGAEYTYDSDMEAVNGTWALSLDDLALSELLPVTRRADYAMGERFAVWDPVRAAVVAFGGYFSGETWTHEVAPTGAWTQIDAGNTPQLTAMAAVYDAAGEAIVAFGGHYVTTSDAVMRLASTPGAKWETLEVEGGPTPRTHHVAVYDPVNRRMIVQGGRSGTDHSAQVHTDTWALALAGAPTWTQLAPSGHQPPERHAPVAVYDAQEQRMIMYGGRGAFDLPLLDVWSLSLAGEPRWERLQAIGTSPGSTLDASAVYDPDGHRMVVVDMPTQSPHGARVFALELDENPTWHQFCPTGLTPAELRVNSGTSPNAVLVDDGLFVTVSGGAFRFDLQTPYCE